MRNYALPLAAMLSLACLASTAVLAADTKTELQAAYDGQCKAGLAKDATAFTKFFDERFVNTDIDGSQEGLDQTVAGVVTPQAGVTFLTCAFTIRKVSQQGIKVTALVTQRVTGTFAQGGGSPQPFVQVQDSTDVWNFSGCPSRPRRRKPATASPSQERSWKKKARYRRLDAHRPA